MPKVFWPKLQPKKYCIVENKNKINLKDQIYQENKIKQLKEKNDEKLEKLLYQKIIVIRMEKEKLVGEREEE